MSDAVARSYLMHMVSIDDMKEGYRYSPPLSILDLGLQLIDAPAYVVDLLATLLLVLELGLQRLELFVDVCDSLARSEETLFALGILLTLESVDLNLELELPTLE